jgi:hypothetical protein
LCEERSTASIILSTLLFLRKFLQRIKVDSLAAQTLVESLKEALDVRTENIFSWWRQKSGGLPIPSSVAKVFLSIPAKSACSA